MICNKSEKDQFQDGWNNFRDIILEKKGDVLIPGGVRPARNLSSARSIGQFPWVIDK